MPWSGHLVSARLPIWGSPRRWHTLLGACGSFSLPSLSLIHARGRPGARRGARNAGDSSAPTRSSAAGGSRRLPRIRPTAPYAPKPRPRAVQTALCDRRRLLGRGDHASGRPGDAAGTAPQGFAERQESTTSVRFKGRPVASRIAKSSRSTGAS